MTSENVKLEEVEDHSIPAFGVSGQFMMTSEEKAIPFEDFNPRKIVALTLDDSLARLFECLTLEYSGSILLTPKWKNFRSQKLKFSEKTRINNAIWRSWHIQFQEDKRPLFCQFDNPLAEMAKKPRPVTLMIEGKYWKRKLEAVATEYQKWRVFYKQMVEDKFQDVELRHQTEEILRLDQEISHNLRTREKERQYPVASHEAQRPGADMGSPLSLVVSQALEMVDSCNLMENMVFSLPDTLFSSLVDNQAVGRVRIGTFKDTADTVQPTLDTLQPSLEAMTPVLDELIEQLEASMKGSAEINWDFDSLEKSYDVQMGLVPSSSASEVVESMDHSGRYTQPYVSVGNIPPVSSVVKPSWPVQTSNVLTHSMCSTASAGNHLEAQLPIWTSAPVIHPNVIGYQTIGNNMPGNFTLQGNTSGREQRLASAPTSLVDIRGSTSAITSRPYLPPTNTAKRLPTPPNACAVEASAGRMIRNSSDSQLYLLAAGDSTPFKPRAHSVLPVELQAPNLVAQLKLTKPRQMLIEEKAKRLRIPRNKSAPGLASLDSTAQLKKTPHVGGVRAKRLGRIPRNRSDSSLASLIRQTEQSANRVRRDSESSDSPPTMRVPGRQGPNSPSQTLMKHQLYHSGGEGTARPSLVNDMVTHLMSKGISMEEILNKLTSMAAAGTVPQAQAISHQITSAASSMVSMLQEQQLAQQQQTSHSTLPPPYPTSPPLATPTDTPKVTTPRSRRKPQIPRPSAKAARTESPTIDNRSGIRSNEIIVQSLLEQNRQMSADSATVDSRKSLGSRPMWGNETSASFVNHGTAAHTLAHMSEPLRLQATGSARQYPIILETGSLAGPDSKRGARADAVNSGTGYLPSMVMTTVSTATAQSEPGDPRESSSRSKTKVIDETNVKDDSSTSSTSFSGTESQTRTGPLTKTLPKEEYKEHRRKVHVSAEQKRRGHIKMGFEQLVELVPALALEGEKKISKATVLKKSVDYILQVQQEHENMQKERERLKSEIENLNIEISNCQQQLPETGVLVNKQDFSELETLFNNFIQERTEQNPKFWIFSVLMRPIFDTYNSTVSTTSPEEFYRTVLNWLEESCSLPKLRPSVLASLREIIKNTTILSDPSEFPEQARLAASALGSQSTFEGLPR